MLHIILADGFEELEAITIIDVLRRCNIEVITVSVTGKRVIHGAHGISVMADALYRNASVRDSEAIILPGGKAAAQTLYAFESLKSTICSLCGQKRIIAAICAAPMVLGDAGILEGVKATCYPGFERFLKGGIATEGAVVEDGNVITGNGPGAALPFVFAIARRFVSADVISKVKKGMILEDGEAQ